MFRVRPWLLQGSEGGMSKSSKEQKGKRHKPPSWCFVYMYIQYNHMLHTCTNRGFCVQLVCVPEILFTFLFHLFSLHQGIYIGYHCDRSVLQQTFPSTGQVEGFGVRGAAACLHPWGFMRGSPSIKRQDFAQTLGVLPTFFSGCLCGCVLV